MIKIYNARAMTKSVIALFTSQFEIKKQLEILLIISTKSVILTKNKNNNSSQIRTLVVSYFLDGTRLDLSKTKKPKTRINTGFLAHFRVEKRSKYMKATGIVRRIDE